MGHYHAGIVDLVVENPSEECKKVLAYITMDERNYEKWGLDYCSLHELMISGEIELSEEEQVIAGNMASSCLELTLSFKSIVETAWCGGSYYQEEYAFNKYDIVVCEHGVERHIITQAMSCKQSTGFYVLARYLEPWLPKDGRCIMAFKYEDDYTWRAICQGVKETMTAICTWDNDSDPKPLLSEAHEAKLNMEPVGVFGFLDIGRSPLDIDFEGDSMTIISIEK